MEITLPVSLGEALDKMTILEIKIGKISDSRKADCEREYSKLQQTLQTYVDRFPYYYRLLKEINQDIWNIQDEFHGKDVDPLVGAALCKKILEENDRRFRVKALINTASGSPLREQKGYAIKRAFVYTHLGLGDMYWMNGAIRYLATAFDKVMVVCKAKYEANVRLMYNDDPNIEFFVVNDDFHFQSTKQRIEAQGFTVFSCGQHTANPRIYDFPLSFYDDLQLPRDIRTRYFHIPTHQEAIDLHAKVFRVSPTYIVVHEQSQFKTMPIWEHVNKTKSEYAILDLNKNHYEPGHPFYEIAQAVVNQPLAHYKKLAEGASEIHLLESSVYCMISHLDLSNVKVKVCYDACDNSNERLGIFSTGTLII
jgi:Family of unknown function (DUF6165)